jgi:hypothetical protein
MTDRQPSALKGFLNRTLTREVVLRLAYVAVVACLVSVPYAIPPLMDWFMGRDPRLHLSLERAVDNMSFHLMMTGGVVGALVLGLLVRTPPNRIPRNGAIVLTLSLGLAVLMSSVVHAGLDFNLRTLLLPAVFMLFYALTILASPQSRQIRGLAALIPLIAVPVSVYAVAQSQGWEILNYSRTAPGGTEDLGLKQMVASTFGHPNYLSSFLAPILPFAVLMAIAPGSRIRRGLGGFCVACIMAGMLAGGTRGAWLATMVAAVPFYLVSTLSPQYRRPLLFTGGLIGVVVALVLVIPNPFFRVQFDVLDRLLASKEIVARLYYWTIALHLWEQNPLLGIGYGNFNVHFWPAVADFQLQPGSEYYQFVLAEMIRGVPPQFVHNDHLQILTEGGILGAGLWLGIWSVTAAQLWDTGRRVRQHAPDLLLVAAFSASFAAYLTDGLTNFPAHIPASGVLMAVLLGLWQVYRARVTSQWMDLTVPPPPPRVVDGLVPELPRIRPPKLRA